MKIEFEITDIPNEEQKKYPVAYLEGILKIFVCNKIFFDQSGILLIEFAISINNWLRNIKQGEIVDFIYLSMDNDEPILFINHVVDNNYKINSIWQEVEVSEFLIMEDIVIEFENFLDDLAIILKLTAKIELNSILYDGNFPN